MSPAPERPEPPGPPQREPARHERPPLDYAAPGTKLCPIEEEGESWGDFARALVTVLVWIGGLLAILFFLFYGCGRVFG